MFGVQHPGYQHGEANDGSPLATALKRSNHLFQQRSVGALSVRNRVGYCRSERRNSTVKQEVDEKVFDFLPHVNNEPRRATHPLYTKVTRRFGNTSAEYLAGRRASAYCAGCTHSSNSSPKSHVEVRKKEWDSRSTSRCDYVGARSSPMSPKQIAQTVAAVYLSPPVLPREVNPRKPHNFTTTSPGTHPKERGALSNCRAQDNNKSHVTAHFNRSVSDTRSSSPYVPRQIPKKFFNALHTNSPMHSDSKEAAAKKIHASLHLDTLSLLIAVSNTPHNTHRSPKLKGTPQTAAAAASTNSTDRVPFLQLPPRGPDQVQAPKPKEALPPSSVSGQQDPQHQPINTMHKADGVALTSLTAAAAAPPQTDPTAANTVNDQAPVPEPQVAGQKTSLFADAAAMLKLQATLKFISEGQSLNEKGNKVKEAHALAEARNPIKTALIQSDEEASQTSESTVEEWHDLAPGRQHALDISLSNSSTLKVSVTVANRLGDSPDDKEISSFLYMPFEVEQRRIKISSIQFPDGAFNIQPLQKTWTTIRNMMNKRHVRFCNVALHNILEISINVFAHHSSDGYGYAPKVIPTDSGIFHVLAWNDQKWCEYREEVTPTGGIFLQNGPLANIHRKWNPLPNANEDTNGAQKNPPVSNFLVFRHYRISESVQKASAFEYSTFPLPRGEEEAGKAPTSLAGEWVIVDAFLLKVSAKIATAQPA